VIGHDHVIGESRRRLFDELQELDIEAMAPGAEFVFEQLRHDVVNIEDELGAIPFRVTGREDQEVGDVVHVNQVVAHFALAPCQDDAGGEEKARLAQSVGPLAALIRFAALYPVDVDTIEGGPTQRVVAAGERDDLDTITTAGERLRVAPHPAVRLIVAIHQHADFLASVA
jgi:hypothetical protein